VASCNMGGFAPAASHTSGVIAKLTSLRA
jgi:hypothetical protein